jgi:hypothetical protein
MPTPTRPLTNDHRDCSLVKLDAKEANSPLVVIQEGYAPGDITARMRMFYLQRDGMWIDEVARSTRPDSEAGDIVFETAADALKVIGTLMGKPMIRSVPVTEADIQTYMARAKGAPSSEAAFREFLARYRAAKGR